MNTKYNIGQKVRVYETKIKENKITKELNVFTDTVVSIVIMRDILTDEEFYMYKLKNKNYLFNEKTLMKQYY